MSTNLVIVESPAKAKTIEKYLGKKFTVSSCYGHIRDLPKDDINDRKLPKNTTGIGITKILKGTPLMFVSVNDVIVELQKKKITSSKQFSNLLKEIIKKGAETLYLAIYNSNNQRSYITVKLK